MPLFSQIFDKKSDKQNNSKTSVPGRLFKHILGLLLSTHCVLNKSDNFPVKIFKDRRSAGVSYAQ